MIGKLNDIRLLLLAALPAFMLGACSQEEMGSEHADSLNAQSREIRFEIGFAPQMDAAQTDAQTRVATDTKLRSTWEEGDEIGIYAVKHGEALATSDHYVHNVKLTYKGGSWTAENDIYWPVDGMKLDFYAYHPYDAEVTDLTSMAFIVDTDQSESDDTRNNYNLSDLLIAKNDNSSNGFGKGETVPLSFTHALAMVQVNVSKSMVGDYAPDMLNVWLNGCTAKGVLNLSTQSATLPANPDSPVKIKMYPCPNDGDAQGIYAYRALVPAQEIAQGTALFRFEYHGNTLLSSKPLEQSLSLVQGQAEVFDMTFPFTSATVSAEVRLEELFRLDELDKITHLKVVGEMTEADFKTIKDRMPAITNLDLGGATVVGEVCIIGKDDIVQGNAIPYKGLDGKDKLKEFIFPRNITVIGIDAFSHCTGLTSLTIPSGVTIGQSAFNSCTGLTSLTIPAGVTIGNNAFWNCTGLTNLAISTGVTIGNYAFWNCTGLKGTLTIPSGVTIGDNAFNSCTGLTALSLSEGIKAIGRHAFSNCPGLTGTLTIPGSLGTIGYEPFSGTKFSTVYISSGINKIGRRAFDSWRNLTTLNIPASVTEIEDGAFMNCTSLSSITCHIADLDKVKFGIVIFANVLSQNVTVYVPEAAVGAYENHEVWRSFNIQSILPPS